MVNKDKTGVNRQSRLRAARAEWLGKNAHGLSAEGLIGALMRGECRLSWSELCPDCKGEKYMINKNGEKTECLYCK